ncbi:hypothetical protein K7W03_00925 [Sphingobium sp. PNB]|uniref:hypothetical protein n=1 Tax=Sphingobium sp. PNB TaxID=863934 RepID=UPI001D00A416|nr:hypothetical protein [Sphingobium sp. PNB]MCB4858148.1 hypothetical protein [Sphingobium sp. PNB]
MMQNALHRPVQWLRDMPARTALRICNNVHFREWLGARHDAALMRHRPRLPRLDAIGRQIVDALEEDGVFVTEIDALGLPGSEAMIDTSAMLAHRFAEEAHSRARDGQTFLYVPPEQIVANPRIFRWGLHERLLDIAEAYIGLPVAYDGAIINYTVADGRAVSTRKWHRDWEDRRMMKVAVYLHDVDHAGGPFQIISRHGAVQDDRSGFSYELADDAELEARLDKPIAPYLVSCEGLRGTVIFTDTARFYHRGKPATARDRAAIFYSYFARRPRHPFLCERTGMKRRDIARLARYLPQRQRNAVLWHRQLSPLLRLIPPASL